jgi:hypothetical protein
MSGETTLIIESHFRQMDFRMCAAADPSIFYVQTDE